MPLSPCHQLARDLKTTIDARMKGEQVQSVGHKGRQLEYADMPIAQLISYYNQIRNSCPDAKADPELIAINPLDQPTGTRGRPAVRPGRPWC
jgi:hypothetical protein